MSYSALNKHRYLTLHFFILLLLLFAGGGFAQVFNKYNGYIYKLRCFSFSFTAITNTIFMILYINHYIYLLKIFLKLYISISVMCAYVVL